MKTPPEQPLPSIMLTAAPTPETDAYIGHDNEDNMTEGEIAMCAYARRLERERDAARAVIEAIDERYIDGWDLYADHEAMGDLARDYLESLESSTILPYKNDAGCEN